MDLFSNCRLCSNHQVPLIFESSSVWLRLVTVLILNPTTVYTEYFVHVIHVLRMYEFHTMTLSCESPCPGEGGSTRKLPISFVSLASHAPFTRRKGVASETNHLSGSLKRSLCNKLHSWNGWDYWLIIVRHTSTCKQRNGTCSKLLESP